jgi:hypothetical protein
LFGREPPLAVPHAICGPFAADGHIALAGRLHAVLPLEVEDQQNGRDLADGDVHQSVKQSERLRITKYAEHQAMSLEYG